MDAPAMGPWAPPETHYARSGSFSIAYQVLGDGPIDLVVVPSFVSNLELTWEWPPMAAFYRAFASFARVILFDKRGTGLSDRVRLMPTTEERKDDLHAVMDAVSCNRAVIVGFSEGAALAVAFVAAHPERATHLVLYGPLPKATRSDDYPWAQPEEWWEQVADHFEQTWGSPEYMNNEVAWRAPSEANNEAFVRWWGVYRRLGASPGGAADLARMNARIDVREQLTQVSVPTLVLARSGDRVVGVEHARYVADHVPGAAYVELPGDDHLPFVGDSALIVTAIANHVGVGGDIAVEIVVEPEQEAQWANALSTREREVLQWVARGKRNAEIATALYISEATVRKHLQHAYEKLGVTSRTAAVALLTSNAG